MSFDQKSPKELKQCQLWFGGVITQPIDEQSSINPIAPSGVPIQEEACFYIKPSPTLHPAQRIELYNQQYWWRLLNTLHDVFPFVTRLFGYSDFNQIIGIPYLIAYPPDHWSLNRLGLALTKWIEKAYEGPDKQLILDAARADQSYHDCFLAKAAKPIDLTDLGAPQDFASLLNRELYLQPFVRLFDLDYDLFRFRDAFLEKDPGYWVENPFPPLDKRPASYIITRNHLGNPFWIETSPTEVALLQLFEHGFTIENACEWIQDQDETVVQEAEQHLQPWIQGWITKKWLFLVKDWH